MPFTYIVECADGSYYVGSTYDVERRVSEHNLGIGSSYMLRAGRRPVRLVFAAEFARIDEAFAFEKRVQGWSRAKRQALIDGRWDDLPDLASRSWRSLQIKDALAGRALTEEVDEDVAGSCPSVGGGGLETGASAPSSTSDR
jgi:putative endonuclease